MTAPVQSEAEQQPGMPDDVAEFLADRRPVSSLSVEELGQRSRKARELLATRGLDPAAEASIARRSCSS